MKRRSVVKVALAGAGVLAAPAYLRAQSSKKLSVLTWNAADQEALFKTEFAEFKAANPGVEIEWLDKKGPDLPAFYQTQIVAGTPPDIVDLQGEIWVDYAANGGLVDLTPYLEKEPDVGKRFNADYLSSWIYKGKTYLLPFYVSKTLLYYNKTMFNDAGLAGPPKSFDEIIGFSEKMAKAEKTGFLTLNFDWLYWPLFKMNGIELLSPDGKKAAFNTQKMADVLAQLAKATGSGAINKISWTGRWVEPNGAFASGTVGMLHAHSASYFFVKGQGPWINGQTLGAAQAPDNWSTPTNHGFAISKGSKNPELAWSFLKHMTSDKSALAFFRARSVLTANLAADKQGLSEIEKTDPLAAAVLRTQVEHTDRLTGNWPLPYDAELKDAFWPEIQNAVLGRKEPKKALADAERVVNRLLTRKA
jgi:ABC-type glycerol-3-phosphate transport system substrate-binding protein